MGVQADPRRQMPCRIDELGVSVSRNGTTEHGHGHGEVDEIWSDDDDSWDEALQLALVARTNKQPSELSKQPPPPSESPNVQREGGKKYKRASLFSQLPRKG
jgi:hypothetical protein